MERKLSKKCPQHLLHGLEPVRLLFCELEGPNFGCSSASPPIMGTALRGLHGWLHIFGGTAGCVECQAQDCSVGSCSTGNKCDQTQRGLKRCLNYCQANPMGLCEAALVEMLEYHFSWFRVTELPSTLKTAASFLCESLLPSQLFAFPQSSVANGS